MLDPIEFCNTVILASDATSHMEVANIESLLAQLVSATFGSQHAMKLSLLHPVCRLK